MLQSGREKTGYLLQSVTQMGRLVFLVSLTLICFVSFSTLALAQAKDEEEQPEPLDPENITLEVNEGRLGSLVLHATYYPSHLGKEAVPIVMLHDYKGSRHDFDTLARALQVEKGHAVIVPDLRGHGESTKYNIPENAPPTFRQKTIDQTRMSKNDFVRIVKGDLEAVRGFLLQENNAAKLNINKLCVVGAGMGSVMALNWAYVDWTAPVLAVGKQGQDIKGLVLISPAWNFRGLPIQDAINNPQVRSQISLLFIYGEQNSSAKRDAQRLYAHFKPHHPDAAGPEAREKRELFDFGLKTPLQGTEILKQPALRAAVAIAAFIDMRLVNQDYSWTDRNLLGD